MSENAGIEIISNFIGGDFVPTDKLIDSFEPATGKVWLKVPDSDASSVDAAAKAANNAFESWSLMPVKTRCHYLLVLADILEKWSKDLSEKESRDQGKTLKLASLMDIPRALLNFRHFAETFPHALNTSNVQAEVSALNYTLRCPIGVAGLITPWNLPLYLLTFKIAPAIAAGNTVVCKPSEFTSYTAWMLCKACKEANLPPGVINIVFGTGARVGQAIVDHPDIPLISFTGSTLTGKRIFQCSAKNFKKLSLEMGGKNAAIVFKDANLEECLQTTIRSSFLNQGEICLCTSRIFVQREIFETFTAKFIDETKKLKVGAPDDPDTFIGALISRDHLAKVRGYVQQAKLTNNAHVFYGQTEDDLANSLSAKNKEGYFMAPVVITGVIDEHPCMTDEIFGPVVCIVPFNTQSEVIKRVNAVKYGLCASVWSQNVNTIHQTSAKLEVGTVWANCWLVRSLDMPFGGTKHSGLGREGTYESLDFYTEQKTICIKYD